MVYATHNGDFGVVYNCFNHIIPRTECLAMILAYRFQVMWMKSVHPYYILR